ncbi:carboxymuconolactone decarboxylase family protein [Parahaliea mediterranea]|uniref:Carboxymuconolactone decarboxylase family protein n=1 Tax=Parahaliea mediterranea TaxID=651086 RepID=A0A939DCT4_9GAMM|nr:carboxymuconolactone decarboxylase family protein [Parahaliea mediterranea]MBN7795860.1 carboxymuconolactone decarboxylase family protein [Parahaliea mediterranea]
MSHIPTPATIEQAPADSQPLLHTVQAALGSVPNLFRLIGNSPETLKGYMSLSGALEDGHLNVATRERIALAVAEVNGCRYCLAAHSYLGEHVAKLTEAEILTNRHGSSGDGKAAVAVEFAVRLVRQRGTLSHGDVQAVLDAGYSAAEVVEIIGHVALNTLTNYVNEALATAIDFPQVNDLID